ncbi:MAG: GntR family transcriptional regulator [Lachnospiraceae bacterium]|jgi:GntR family transcriptional regulator|nr:GntR family transcriptional regulator [Lachnospiraceae bacterium]
MFLLDLQSKDPIYQQIQDQLRRFIDAGVLKPGDRLPSVRQCAQDNGINPNTVAKAYGELEKAGYVHNFVKKGVYVADVKSSAPDPKTESVIRSLWESGVTREEIEKAIMRVYDGAEGRITEIKSETVPETVNESGRNAVPETVNESGRNAAPEILSENARGTDTKISGESAPMAEQGIEAESKPKAAERRNEEC